MVVGVSLRNIGGPWAGWGCWGSWMGVVPPVCPKGVLDTQLRSLLSSLTCMVSQCPALRGTCSLSPCKAGSTLLCPAAPSRKPGVPSEVPQTWCLPPAPARLLGLLVTEPLSSLQTRGSWLNTPSKLGRWPPSPLGWTHRLKRNWDTGVGSIPLGAGGETEAGTWVVAREVGFSKLEKSRFEP